MNSMYSPKFFAQSLEALFPKVEGFLKGETDFQFLVAIILSAQMTDKGVNKTTEKFFQVIKNAEDALKIGEEKIYDFIKSVNYAPTKAKNIFNTSKIICEKFEGKVPKKKLELLSLPGVGNKTAGVFVTHRKYDFAFPVDTHIKRVATAFGFTKEKDPTKIEQDLQKKFPKEIWFPLHIRMILYGRNYLKARNIPKTKKMAWENLEQILEKNIKKKDKNGEK